MAKSPKTNGRFKFLLRLSNLINFSFSPIKYTFPLLIVFAITLVFLISIFNLDGKTF